MVDILESLEIKVAGSGNIMTVTPPTIRQDLLEEEDYIEEVARIYGYDKMPVTLPKGNTEAGIPEDRALRDLTRDSLCGMGLIFFCKPEGCGLHPHGRRLLGEEFRKADQPAGRRELRYENGSDAEYDGSIGSQLH